MGHRSQRVDRVLRLLGQGDDAGRDLVGAFAFGDRPGDPELHLQRHHLLLGAVVQIAFESMAFGILGGDQPLA